MAFFNHFPFVNSKKGFELQFNWIFVIIGGSIFLIFLFMLITRTTASSEEEMGLSSQREVGSLFRASHVSTETQKILLFDKRISFFCASLGNDFVSEYYVGSSKLSTDYNYQVIFAPSFLDGEELIMKIAPFEMPFNVMSFLYLTNKYTEFVFIGEETPLFLQLASLLPMNTSFRFAASLSSYKNTNFDHTVFILSSSSASTLPSSLANFNKPSDQGRAHLLLIDSEAEMVDSYGTVTFYEYEPGTGFVEEGVAGFMGRELLLGAVMSHDYSLYSCELRKALLRFNFTLELHKEKLKLFSESLSSCKSSYDMMIQDIATIQSSISYPDPALDKAYPLVLDIASMNDYLVRSTECTLMY